MVADAQTTDGVARQGQQQRQKTFQHALVLDVVECAGGIDHRAAGTEHFCGLFQNLHLAVGTAVGRIRIPFAPRFRLAAEHAFAGAGRVYQNAVKKTAKSLPQMFSRFIEHNHIRRAHALDIRQQHRRAFCHKLIGVQNPCAAKRCRNAASSFDCWRNARSSARTC
mgnify:CR=1 FL=1